MKETIYYLLDNIYLFKFYIIAWILFNSLVTYYIKKTISPLYKAKEGKLYKEKKEIVINDIKAEYPEFSKNDNEVDFISLLFSLCTITWLRIFCYFFVAFLMWVHCK